jgi:serine/threonine-protein kinase
MADERDAEAFLETLCPLDETGFLKVGASIAPPVSNPKNVLERFAKSESGGQLEDRLKFMGTIGKGGMGLVRLAEQRSLGREVAVKGLRPDQSSDTAAASLLSEAWITGALEHPNVIPVHDLAIDGAGRPIVIMKRVRGVEWFDLMGDAKTVQERFGASDLLEWNISILLQVINAIRLAHSRDIVHRDLKPANVMIGEFGEVYVLDWGIATSVAKGCDRGARPDTPFGTPGYMAPEMLHCEAVSVQTDIYLVGATLFEIATGRLPHQARSVEALIESIENSPPAVPEDVPEEIAAICIRAMAADPADRYPDLDAVQRALQQFLSHRSAAQLALRADQRLEALESKIAELRVEARLEDAAAEGVYSLFSECRFAYREALAGWPENGSARAGLSKALHLMIEFELDNDEPRAAQNLLSELEEDEAELTERVETAARVKARHLERLGTLDELHDLALGWQVRTGLVLSMIVVFCLVPLFVGWTYPEIRSHYDEMFLASFALLLLTGGMAFWGRKLLFATAFNRRLTMTALLVPIAQMVLTAAAGILVLPQRAFVLALFLWFVMTSMFAISTANVLFISPICYLIAFFVAAYEPDWVFYAMAISNLVMLLSISFYSLGQREAEAG